MIIKAKNLKVGDKYLSKKCIFEVIEIDKITNVSITFKIDRILPESTFIKDWEQRKRLNTKIELLNK